MSFQRGLIERRCLVLLLVGATVSVPVGVAAAEGVDYALADGRIGVIDLRADQPAIQLITPAGLKAMYPDWSPDGSRILFAAGNLDPFFGTDDPNDLYTVKADGSDLVRITNGEPGRPRFGTPTWTRAEPPIVVTFIDAGQFSLGALEAGGSAAMEIVDAGGTSIAGAHPRVWVAP